MFGASYQFEKQGRSSDIHLELVFGKITLSRSADQCRIEIHIVNDSIKVILSRSTNVATDTEGEFSLLVGKQEARRVRVMETHLRTVVHDTDDFIARFIP